MSSKSTLIGYIIHPETRRIEYPLYKDETIEKGCCLICPGGYFINPDPSELTILNNNVTRAGYIIVNPDAVTQEEILEYKREVGIA